MIKKFIARRLLVAVPVLFAITLATFLLVHALPGSPFDAIENKARPESAVMILIDKYKLDRPLYVQFGSYVWNLLHGDLGIIYNDNSGQKVNDIVAQTFPVSIQLGLLSLLLGMLIGVPAGIIAAIRRNTMTDHAATFLAVLGVSIPNLVLGPVLIYIFGVELDWFPNAFWGADPPFALGFLPPMTAKFWTHAVMPVFTLGTGISAGLARLTRAGLLDVLNEDYLRTARSKGLRERVVVVVHALKNALIPVATVMGPLFAGVLTGSLVVEQIFAINGMGRRFIQGIGEREYLLVTSLTLIFSVLLITGNIVVDVMYAWLDPRIRYD
ncbi:MAG: ABC transporter permease [Anaerolineae bacterium]|nr:ABC transporter permease [Anaerolineae bacterium]